MSKKRGQVIRIGDVVKIINPEFFIRCGYHLMVDDMLEQVNEGDLVDFCRGHGIKRENIAFEKIRRALAYHLLEQCHFGGPERQIYTKHWPSYIGCEAEVIGKKFVKTGIREATTVEFNDDGTPIEGPPYSLVNEKTHIILHISSKNFPHNWDEAFSTYPFCIESCHVEKIINKEPPDVIPF